MFPRIPLRLPLIVAMTAALCASYAIEASASCLTTPVKDRRAPTSLPFAGRATTQGAAPVDVSGTPTWLVGLWLSEFRVGTALYDQTLQQFHGDGTENMLSNGLPPTLGNVCVGVWAQVGPRTIKLRHLAWNWDANGQFLGLFQMIVTLEVDRTGTRYTGTFVADSFDLANNVIPALHVEGTAQGARITVD
jgi:hypothetical protein